MNKSSGILSPKKGLTMNDQEFINPENIQSIKTFFDISKSLVNFFKQCKESLPIGKNKENVEKEIAIAERQLEVAESEIAQKLGYPICHCKFPPEIMLCHDKGLVYKCPNCDHTKYKNTNTGKLSY